MLMIIKRIVTKIRQSQLLSTSSFRRWLRGKSDNSWRGDLCFYYQPFICSISRYYKDGVGMYKFMRALIQVLW